MPEITVFQDIFILFHNKLTLEAKTSIMPYRLQGT